VIAMVMAKPVEVPYAAYAFCRWLLALLLWAAFLFRLPLLVALAACLLALSALLGVKRAPLIVLYRCTLHRLLPSRDVVLDEHAMRFAHTLGTLLTATCFALLLLAPRAGRAMLACVVVAKTVGALGFCPGAKLYECLISGSGCCGMVRNSRD
jgi:hypothetical protein